MTRLMSDAEIRRRKKLQGHISYTTGTLGLAGLSAFTAGRLGNAGAKTGKLALKAQKAVPALKRINPKKADEVALGASTTAGGIGGLGAFNFGAYTNAESRKKKPVVKSYSSPVDDAFSGEIAKAYDPEEKRMKRANAYQAATVVGAGAGGAATVHQGLKTTKKLKRVRVNDMIDSSNLKIAAMQDAVPSKTKKGGFVQHNTNPAHMAVKTKDFSHNMTRATPAKDIKAVARGGAKTAIAAGATGAAIYANRKIKRKKNSTWSPYVSKSAFGVSHD